MHFAGYNCTRDAFALRPRPTHERPVISKLSPLRQHRRFRDRRRAARPRRRPCSRWLGEHGLDPLARVARPGRSRAHVELREALRQALLANSAPTLPGADLRAPERSDRRRRRWRLRFEPEWRVPRSSRPARGSTPRSARSRRSCAVAMRGRRRGRGSRSARPTTASGRSTTARETARGTWCDMAVCGNRAKVRAFRAPRDRGSQCGVTSALTRSRFARRVRL